MLAAYNWHHARSARYIRLIHRLLTGTWSGLGTGGVTLVTGSLHRGQPYHLRLGSYLTYVDTLAKYLSPLLLLNRIVF